jgi:hypothetical protein
MAEPVEGKAIGDDLDGEKEQAASSAELPQRSITASQQEPVPTDVPDLASETKSAEVIVGAAHLSADMTPTAESALHGQSADQGTDNRQWQSLKEEAASVTKSLLKLRFTGPLSFLF